MLSEYFAFLFAKSSAFIFFAVRRIKKIYVPRLIDGYQINFQIILFFLLLVLIFILSDVFRKK